MGIEFLYPCRIFNFVTDIYLLLISTVNFFFKRGAGVLAEYKTIHRFGF